VALLLKHGQIENYQLRREEELEFEEGESWQRKRIPLSLKKPCGAGLRLGHTNFFRIWHN